MVEACNIVLCDGLESGPAVYWISMAAMEITALTTSLLLVILLLERGESTRGVYAGLHRGEP